LSAPHLDQQDALATRRPSPQHLGQRTTVFCASHFSSAKDLEAYAELLQLKVEELEKGNMGMQSEKERVLQEWRRAEAVAAQQAQKYHKLATDYERLQAMYSTLALDSLALRQKEKEHFSNFIAVSQEKEKLMADSEAEAAHQRLKINLLQEALTKRNQEYDKVFAKNKQLVP
jgi:hypothetical protein